MAKSDGSQSFVRAAASDLGVWELIETIPKADTVAFGIVYQAISEKTMQTSYRRP